MPTRLWTATEFQNATALRAPDADPIGRVIGDLLNRFHAAPDNSALKTFCLGRLYFAADMWLSRAGQKGAAPLMMTPSEINRNAFNATKHPQSGARLAGSVLPVAFRWNRSPGSAPEVVLHAQGTGNDVGSRLAAVQIFWKSVVDRLCQDTQVPVNLVPMWLEETFGQNVSQEKVKQDKNLGAKYDTPSQLERYGLTFISGLCYAKEWWRYSQALVPANSSQIRLVPAGDLDADRIQTDVEEGYAGYVVTLAGKFYSTWHSYQGIFRYHSSYLQGNAVLCAGQWKIEAGVVRAINNDSGHYQPGADRLRDAVEVLAMLGVDMDTLQVKDVVSKVHISGRRFLRDYPPDGVVVLKAQERGDTPIHTRQMSQTWEAFDNAFARAWATFQEHWKPVHGLVNADPKPPVPHGPALPMLEKCDACKSLKSFWAPYRIAATRAGAVGNARPTQQEAKRLFNLLRIQELFRDHWRPPALGHGSDEAALNRCPQCVKWRPFWEAFRAAIRVHGGQLGDAEFTFEQVHMLFPLELAQAQAKAQSKAQADAATVLAQAAANQAQAVAVQAAAAARNLELAQVAGNDSIFIQPALAQAPPDDPSAPDESDVQLAQRYAPLFRAVAPTFDQAIRAAAAGHNPPLRIVDQQADANLYIKPYIHLESALQARVRDEEGLWMKRWTPVVGFEITVAARNVTESFFDEELGMVEAVLWKEQNHHRYDQSIRTMAPLAIARLYQVAQQGR